MQEKKQNISPIKQRILHFAATLGISKRDFYGKIGVSRGTLESKTGITEDVVTKFFATYPEVSVEWLLTGQGEMLKTKRTSIQQNGNDLTKSIGKDNIFLPKSQALGADILEKLFQNIAAKDAKIIQQAEEIGTLKEQIRQLELEKERLASAVRTSSAANAG